MRPDLARVLPAERGRPAGENPPGHRFETGTLSHEAIAGFVAAVEYLASLGAGQDLAERLDRCYESISAHEADLARAFGGGLAELAGLRSVGAPADSATRRVPTFGLICERRTPLQIACALGTQGIYTWNGNFYAKRVVETLGLDLDEGLLRIGMVHYNSAAEIERTLSALAEVVR